jgi:hypothetical protein
VIQRQSGMCASILGQLMVSNIKAILSVDSLGSVRDPTSDVDNVAGFAASTSGISIVVPCIVGSWAGTRSSGATLVGVSVSIVVACNVCSVGDWSSVTGEERSWVPLIGLCKERRILSATASEDRGNCCGITDGSSASENAEQTRRFHVNRPTRLTICWPAIS